MVIFGASQDNPEVAKKIRVTAIETGLFLKVNGVYVRSRLKLGA